MRELSESESQHLEVALNSNFGWSKYANFRRYGWVKFGFVAGLDYRQVEIERLQTEVNQLRAALKTLVEWTESQGVNVKVYDSDSGDTETEWAEIAAARAALKNTKIK